MEEEQVLSPDSPFRETPYQPTMTQGSDEGEEEMVFEENMGVDESSKREEAAQEAMMAQQHERQVTRDTLKEQSAPRSAGKKQDIQPSRSQQELMSKNKHLISQKSL